MIKDDYNKGLLTLQEVERLRKELTICYKCQRPASRGEIEDLGCCSHCDHLQSEIYEAEFDNEWEQRGEIERASGCSFA